MNVGADVVVTPLLRELLELYPSLSPAERKVADQVVGNPREVVGLTAEGLAARAHVSQPVASRLCRRLSTRSFSAFRVELARQLGELGAASAAGASGGGVAGRRGRGRGGRGGGRGGTTASGGFEVDAELDDELRGAASEAIRRTREDLDVALRAVSTLDFETLDAAAEALVSARTIVCGGFDTSRAVAERFARLLRREGLQARPEYDYMATPSAAELGKGDVVLLITYRGIHPEHYRVGIATAARRGATIVVLTNQPNVEIGADPTILVLTHAPSQMTDDEYATGPAVFVQFAVMRALWGFVRRRLG